MIDERALSGETISEMVRAIDPDWRVRGAELAEGGHCAVYRVAVETPDGPRKCVLKAPPDSDGDASGIRTESRLLAILSERTSIPVPNVVGAVDDHENLRAPFFLMDAMPGVAVAYRDVGTLSDAALGRTARETGEHLAQLHAVDAVDSFGLVSCDASAPLRGGRPSADLDQLTVADSCDSWPALVREWADGELDRLADARFGDLAPRLRPAFDAEIDALSGSFAPILARIDHGVHNLLVRPETGAVTAVIDWAFALAATPAYDLVCVEHVLSGAVLSPIPGAPDRRELVREAMLDGYGPIAGPLADELRDHRSLYDLLAAVRSMNHLAAGAAEVPEEHVETVAGGLRETVENRLDGSAD